MQQALDSTTDIDEDSKTRMNNFFRYKLMSSELSQVTKNTYIYAE